MFVWYAVSTSLLYIIITNYRRTFIRFKLLLKAPNDTGDDDGDSESVIRKNALEKGVLALPGTVFLPDGRKTAYVRVSFSLLNETDVEEATRRLKEVILEARKDLP
jgi:tryptophan aminotransferase